MKFLVNGLLFLIFGICAWLLVFQDYAAPTLSPLGNFFLRFLVAVTGQWLVCRIARTGFRQMLPVICTSFFAVWGFFLMLTSPSWRHATFGRFLADYVTPTAGCWGVWLLYHRYYM